MSTENEMPKMAEAISLITIETIQESYKAWQTKDFKIIDELFSPEWQDIPAAPGQKVKVSTLELHHLKDGKITHTWHQEDWFGLLMQSGALKQD